MIMAMLISPYSQIDLAQQFPDVTFIDATYRTSYCIRFMVVTSYQKTVSVAVCFVASEEEAMYNRAINAFTNEDNEDNKEKRKAFLADEIT
jgi:SWIM-type zinc finger protein